jgi:hypothetical protein
MRYRREHLVFARRKRLLDKRDAVARAGFKLCYERLLAPGFVCVDNQPRPRRAGANRSKTRLVALACKLDLQERPVSRPFGSQAHFLGGGDGKRVRCRERRERFKPRRREGARA